MAELEGKGKQEIINSVQLLKAGGMGYNKAVEPSLIEKGRQLLVWKGREEGNHVQIVILVTGR